MSLFKNMFGDLEDSDTPKNNVNWKSLTNINQLDEIAALSAETPVAIFKHSTRCGVSRMVLRQFENEFRPDTKVTPYFLDLLAYRDVSNAISEKFNVMHQSPQLLLIKDGKSVYDASHGDISPAELSRNL
jgi:bacillithiol system protein YtxJ